jgi:hypothetical protein
MPEFFRVKSKRLPLRESAPALGGNQQNPNTGIFEVSEKLYPKTDFLEYRSPSKK